jgi:putative endonuclease
MLLRDAVVRLKSRLFPNDRLGRRGERAAVTFLKRQRYTIIHRGYRILGGELDIVAVEGRTVVFVEVKTRVSHDAGHPAEAVDPHKQRQLTQLALAYLRRYHLLDYSARFDVIAITWPANQKKPTIEHIKNAFESPGQGQMFS